MLANKAIWQARAGSCAGFYGGSGCIVLLAHKSLGGSQAAANSSNLVLVKVFLVSYSGSFCRDICDAEQSLQPVLKW